MYVNSINYAHNLFILLVVHVLVIILVFTVVHRIYAPLFIADICKFLLHYVLVPMNIYINNNFTLILVTLILLFGSCIRVDTRCAQRY